jgi:hypothetical protein
MISLPEPIEHHTTSHLTHGGHHQRHRGHCLAIDQPAPSALSRLPACLAPCLLLAVVSQAPAQAPRATHARSRGSEGGRALVPAGSGW